MKSRTVQAQKECYKVYRSWVFNFHKGHGMQYRCYKLNFLRISFCILCTLVAPSTFALEKVSLQLRWDHQFQFAGYYAALWQGYYEDAGLDVDIRSAVRSPSHFLSSVKEVEEGGADFGIGAADILIANDKGAELVVLASVFQRSAAGFYALKSTALDTPESLLSLRVARRENDLIDVELQAMLRASKLDPAQIKAYRHQPGMEHLISGQVDVIPGYAISLPITARAAGVKIRSILPFEHGVDFYGDSIFTSAELVHRSPEVVDRFTEASLRGWQYALENSVEIADLISNQLPRISPLPEGFFEVYNLLQAHEVEELALYPTVEIGHINSDRWRNMHANLSAAGLIRGQFDPGALFVLQDDDDHIYMNWLREWGQGLLLLVISIGLFITLWSQVLKARIARALEAYDTSEQRFRSTFEQSAVGIAHTGLDGQLLRVNQRFADEVGYSVDEFKTKNIRDIMSPEDLGDEIEIIEKLTSGELPSHNAERRYRCKDGSLFWGAFTVSCAIDKSSKKPAYFIVVMQDISERKAAEREQESLQQVLQQTQRLDALGKLTGGIAHDFNNTLGLMLGNLQLARQFSSTLSPEEMVACLQSAEDAGNQGRLLVEQLMMFARGGIGKQQRVKLEPLADEIIQLFKSSLKPEIELIMVCQSDLPEIMIDPCQFQQVLMNLMINARDAIEGGGVVEVRLDSLSPTTPCPFKAERSSCPGAMQHSLPVKDKPGCAFCCTTTGKETFMVVSVTDSGSGISEQNANYIFDPFFTTKAKGDGHGLGLSVVHGIVESSGGQILVDSELGVGTSIRVLFPSVELSDEDRKPFKAVPDRSKPSPAASGERVVIVVDDEPGIVEYVSRAFSMSGQQVVSEVDSSRALERIRQDDPPIALLITDQRMPKMTGMQLAKAAREINPNLPIMLCSGYADDLDQQEMQAMNIHFFSKPISIDQLLNTAFEILDGQ